MKLRINNSFVNRIYSDEYHYKLKNGNHIITGNKSYCTNVSFGNIFEHDIIPKSEFIIDSGNNITTMPYSHLIDHSTCRYKTDNIKDINLKRRLNKFDKQILHVITDLAVLNICFFKI